MLEKFVSGDAKEANSSIGLLSNRELTVFLIISQGRKASQIAEKLHLSVKAIESYRSHIKEKVEIERWHRPSQIRHTASTTGPMMLPDCRTHAPHKSRSLPIARS